MKISVIGCGYLGAVHAACMAKLGHDVVGVDVDEAKVARLASGRAPFFEPDFEALLTEQLEQGRLRFTTDAAEVAGARVHFVAVGTPQREGSQAADMRYVDAAITAVLPHLAEGDLVVGKSTVPVGTAARLAVRVAERRANLAWNPEFLREGFAIQDTLSPDRFVYGVDAVSAEDAQALLDEVYATPLSAGTPRVVTDYATAELVKVSANAFLATKISFINAMSEICAASGGDVSDLAEAIGYDDRIGKLFLRAGVGFGGGCLPKDIRAFVARAEELGTGQSLTFLTQVDEINLRQRDRVVDMVLDEFPAGIEGVVVAILGLAFKPNSDDLRDSPALDVARRLHSLGATVVATDPEAAENAQAIAPELTYSTTTAALTGADVVVLLTEWAEFKQLDPAQVAQLTRGRTVIDGRNALSPQAWREAGWAYRGMGRRA